MAVRVKTPGEHTMLQALHLLSAQLHGMLAGTSPWDPFAMDTAERIVEWWEARRAMNTTIRA